MKAQNLTVCIPNKGCNKNCPYCVSRMTGDKDSNVELMKRNTPKVISLAKAAQVNSVLLTGKGEPTLNFEDLLYFTQAFSEFPVELQTNALIFKGDDLRYLGILAKRGLNVVAVSIDSLEDLNPYGELFEYARSRGMISRATFNITKMLPKDFKDLVSFCQDYGVHQMTVRNVVIPNHTESTKHAEWIKNNTSEDQYAKIKKEMVEACNKDGFLLRSLPHGSKVYDYKGLSVSYSDYCIQDTNNEEDIRSLIFQEDGHCYTSWNSKASILF